MPNSEPSRARQKIQKRAKLRARAATPDDQLDRHLDQLLEEQQELEDMLTSKLPSKADLGDESGYDPDPEDCDQEQETDEVDTDKETSKVETTKEEPQRPEIRWRQVTFAHHVLSESSSSPPPLSESPPPLAELVPPPIPPPRTCPHLLNNTYPRLPSAAGTPQPLSLRAGKCTLPKVSGQGYDPPFLYPEFIAKNPQSRVNYILTLVDSLILQMDRFGKPTLMPEGEEEGAVKPSTGAIPKIRLANSHLRDAEKKARGKSGSRTRSQSKGRNSKKTPNSELDAELDAEDAEFDMDVEMFQDMIADFRNYRVRGGSHYYFDDTDPLEKEIWEILKKNKEPAQQAVQSKKKGKKAKKASAEQAEKVEKAEQPLTTQKIDGGQSPQGCGACAAGRTLDVIRGHLSRADYTDGKAHKRRSSGQDSSSSSSTATMTPATRPGTPDVFRRPSRPSRQLEQLLDPNTDWPASRKRDGKQRRTLESIFNMTPALAPTRIAIVPTKRPYPYQTGAVGGAAAGAAQPETLPTIRSTIPEESLVSCIKKTNK